MLRLLLFTLATSLCYSFTVKPQNAAKNITPRPRAKTPEALASTRKTSLENQALSPSRKKQSLTAPQPSQKPSSAGKSQPNLNNRKRSYSPKNEVAVKQEIEDVNRNYKSVQPSAQALVEMNLKETQNLLAEVSETHGKPLSTRQVQDNTDELAKTAAATNYYLQRMSKIKQ